MQLFRKILCPVDFSKYSETALRYALALARDHDANLILYHSVPDLSQAISYLEGNYMATVNENLQASALLKLDEFLQSHGPENVRVRKEVGKGNPSEAILEIAREHSVNLIVMGTHGYAGPERFF